MTTSGPGAPRVPCAWPRSRCGPGSSAGTGSPPRAWIASSPTARTSPGRSVASGTARPASSTRPWTWSASAPRPPREQGRAATSCGSAPLLPTSGSTSPWRPSAPWARRCGSSATGQEASRLTSGPLPAAHPLPRQRAGLPSCPASTATPARCSSPARRTSALLRWRPRPPAGPSSPTPRAACSRPSPPRTGLFFSEQTPAALAAAVRQFDAWEAQFRPEEARTQAQRFSKAAFQRGVLAEVEALLGLPAQSPAVTFVTEGAPLSGQPPPAWRLMCPGVCGATRWFHEAFYARTPPRPGYLSENSPA